jgi:hypothetical protein
MIPGLARILASIGLAATAGDVALGAQCAMCRTLLATPEGEQIAAALRSGIWILLVAPFGTFVVIAPRRSGAGRYSPADVRAADSLNLEIGSRCQAAIDTVVVSGSATSQHHGRSWPPLLVTGGSRIGALW